MKFNLDRSFGWFWLSLFAAFCIGRFSGSVRVAEFCLNGKEDFRNAR